jgi:uncharacterized protein (DUF427 family)
VGDAIAENVAWSYEHPDEAVAEISNMIAFYADRMDAWHEDG